MGHLGCLVKPQVDFTFAHIGGLDREKEVSNWLAAR